jgi:hypothetical protein
MSNRRLNRVRIAAFVAGVAMIALLAGCTSAPSGTTAKAAYKLAMSSLSTMAPEGKLLIAQATEPINSRTTTAGWEFLVGDPKTNKVFAVIVSNGKAQAQEYGNAGLSASEWAKIPALSEWKIDSDKAIETAVKFYPAGSTAQFFPGFVTYIPQSASQTDTVKPMTWVFDFDPATRGTAPTNTVEVDLRSGVATYAK